MRKVKNDGSFELPVVSFESLEAAGLFETKLAALFHSEPIGVVDIGARWGVSDVFRPIAPLCHVVAFEADAAEAARIEETESRSGRWAAIEVSPFALWSDVGRVTLRLLRRPNNSSVFPVDDIYRERYRLVGFEADHDTSVEAVTLESFWAATKRSRRHFMEMAQIDTQGAELRILQGAGDILRRETAVLVTEASFFTPYRGGALHFELEPLLRGAGLALYGLLDLKYRNTRRVDKRRILGRERLMQADAVYLRDPFEPEARREPPSPRSVAIVFIGALVLGYFDLCLELLAGSAALWGEDEAVRRELSSVMATLGQVAQADLLELVDATRARIAGDQENALVHLGKLVDQFRDFHGYQELQT